INSLNRVLHMSKASRRAKKSTIVCPYCVSNRPQNQFKGCFDDFSIHLLSIHPANAHKLETIRRWHQAKLVDSKLCKFCDKFELNLIAHYRSAHLSQFAQQKSVLTGKHATKTARLKAAQRIDELRAYIFDDKPLPPYPPSSEVTNGPNIPSTSAVSTTTAGLSFSQQQQRPPRPSQHRIYINYDEDSSGEENDCSVVMGDNFANNNGISNSLPAIDPAVAAAADALLHPAVLPNELTFFEHVATLLKPTALRPTRLHGMLPYRKTASCHMEFCLTQQQAESVALMRTRDPTTGRSVNGMQILLRCFKSESGPQADSFPHCVSFFVNNQPVLGLPDPLPCRFSGADPIIPGAPIDISGLCRVGNSAINRLRVSWLHRILGAGHCLSITLARVVTPNELTKRLLSSSNKVRSVSETLQQIRQLLLIDDNSNGADAAVAMTTLTASLRCPLSRTRIELPVRGLDCRHVQCFDARTYLSMNERKSTWRCPCCDRPAPFASLRVDAHFQSVLADAPVNVDSVRFLDDGTWQPIEDSTPTVGSSESSVAAPVGKSSLVIDSIAIPDDEDSNVEKEGPSVTKNNNNNNSNNNKNKQSKRHDASKTHHEHQAVAPPAAKRGRLSAPSLGNSHHRRRAASSVEQLQQHVLTVDLTGDSD
ncbi:hypothetical protein BOX15_Mlig033988g1, partial [Macrostomum lignano]